MPPAGDEWQLTLDTAHCAMLEGTPTIHFSESIHQWASDPGEVVSRVPGMAAHTWIHNPGVVIHNFNECDMDAVMLWHHFDMLWLSGILDQCDKCVSLACQFRMNTLIQTPKLDIWFADQ